MERKKREGIDENEPEKGKGRDLGYALAASSCEGAKQRGVCTITALDAITAFAVPNPNYPSQSSRFFRVWSFSGSPQRTNHSAYFGLANLCFDQPFQPSTGAKVNTCLRFVNADYWCKVRTRQTKTRTTQLIEEMVFNGIRKLRFLLLHNIMHSHEETE